ncbi:hypothetical protein JCM11251_003331 [Rhodosporidiobolus azoricus]
MASASNTDPLFALAEERGTDPALVASARCDPVARAFLQILLAPDPSTEVKTPSSGPRQSSTPASQLQRVIGEGMKQPEEERDSPCRRPSFAPRQALISSVNADRNPQTAIGSRPSSALISFMGVPKTFSNRPLEELSPINLDDMLVAEQHKGRYLLARIMSKPVLESSINMVVEDPKGQAVYFSAFWYPLHGVQTGLDLDSLFPIGQVLVVKEPLLRTSSRNGDPVLRADSPSDVVFLQPHDPLLVCVKWAIPSPANPLPASFDYKAHGNSLFKAKKYLLAVKAYTDGLALAKTDEPKLLLHLNRAQAHLRIDNFGSAYRDTSIVLSLCGSNDAVSQPTKLKALYRHARALKGMRLLSQAEEAYAVAVKADPVSLEVKAGQERVAKMLRESRTGDFDWLAMEKVDRVSDVGDYVGPVEVVKLKERGGGRGVGATRDIQAGELLLVEKSFAIGDDPNASAKHPLAALASRTRMLTQPAQLHLVSNTIHRMLDDPSAAAMVYSLHGGQQFPPTGNATFAARTTRSIDDDEEVYIDTARIEALLYLNRPLSSNHACIGNATWTVISDLVVIRARIAIKKGEEILIPYLTVDATFMQRQQLFRDHFDDGQCNCEVCKLDKEDGQVKVNRRWKLYNEIVAIKDTNSPGLLKKGRIANLIDQMEDTYSSTRPLILRPELALPYRALANATEQHSPVPPFLHEAISYDFKALEAAGAIVVRSDKDIKVVQAPATTPGMAVPLLLNAAARHFAMAFYEENDETKMYIRGAIRMDRILRGSHRRRFISKWGFLIDEYNLEAMLEREFENA